MNLRDFLHKADIKNKDLADACELTPEYISMVKRGRRRPHEQTRAVIIWHANKLANEKGLDTMLYKCTCIISPSENAK